MSRSRIFAIATLRAFPWIALFIAFLWIHTLDRELRRLRASMPEDHEFEISQLRTEVDELKRNVEDVQAVAADAESSAAAAEDAVEDLRSDVISLALSR